MIHVVISTSTTLIILHQYHIQRKLIFLFSFYLKPNSLNKKKKQYDDEMPAYRYIQKVRFTP